MSNFFENVKATLGEKKSQYKFSKSLSRLASLELDMPYTAHKAVLEEVSEIFPGFALSPEAAGMPPTVYRKFCGELVAGYFDSEKFNPESMKGSVAAQFNFLIVLAICHANQPVDAGKFVKTLDWAVSQAGLEDFQIWSREKIGFANVLSEYRANHLPRLVIETRLRTFDRKVTELRELKKLDKETFGVIYFAEGLRNSYISRYGTNPPLSISRYIENTNPELISQVYIAPFFSVSSSLKYNPTASFENLLFCEDLIIVAPESNTGLKCPVIKRNDVKKIVSGYAFTAVVTDGIAEQENHLIYIKIFQKNGSKKIVYQSIGRDKEEARAGLKAARKRIDLLSDFYPFEWSDEIIDESKHYKTTTTYTTTMLYVSG